MSRTEFKKTVKTTFSGTCGDGNGWTEKVKTTKQANKAFRKASKNI